MNELRFKIKINFFYIVSFLDHTKKISFRICIDLQNIYCNFDTDSKFTFSLYLSEFLILWKITPLSLLSRCTTSIYYVRYKKSIKPSSENQLFNSFTKSFILFYLYNVLSLPEATNTLTHLRIYTTPIFM